MQKEHELERERIGTRNKIEEVILKWIRRVGGLEDGIRRDFIG